MKIAFRVDASFEIGTGHVMRCLTLAHALRTEGHTCQFITRALPGNLADRITAEGFDVRLLPRPQGVVPLGPPRHAHWAGVNWSEDACQTRSALKSAPDWIVLDHYSFDDRWQKMACPRNTRLMVIDDLSDRAHACDLLLDQNFGHEFRDYDGLVPDDCKRLIGPQNALLRSEFRKLRDSALAARQGRALKRLMITMGGVDLIDATSDVLNALAGCNLPQNLEISVVMGAQAPAIERVRALARRMPCPVQVAVDVSDMALRMANSDLAIGAGGSTTWERCSLGLPTIVVETADNQSGVADALARVGAGFAPGVLHGAEFASALSEAITQAANPTILAAMSVSAAALCDGRGSERVVAALEDGGACEDRYTVHQ